MSAATVVKDPQALVRDAIARLNTIATLPEVTAKIISTVEDPRSSAAALHRIVSHDPALVTRILKVVNSAFYGLPGQIASIERAIVLLGLNAVKNIAVAASLGQLFRGVRLCEGYTAKDLWAHCIAVAVASREIARQMKLPVQDEAFLAGMIHDVGLLVSVQSWPEQLRTVCEHVKATRAEFAGSEREMIGVDHQMLGEALADKWQFPQTCRLAAGQHHQPTVNGEQSSQIVAIVWAADTIVCQAGIGFPLTAAHQELSEDICRATGLDRPTLDRVAVDLPTLVQNAAALLS